MREQYIKENGVSYLVCEDGGLISSEREKPQSPIRLIEGKLYFCEESRDLTVRPFTAKTEFVSDYQPVFKKDDYRSKIIGYTHRMVKEHKEDSYMRYREGMPSFSCLWVPVTKDMLHESSSLQEE